MRIDVPKNDDTVFRYGDLIFDEVTCEYFLKCIFDGYDYLLNLSDMELIDLESVRNPLTLVARNNKLVIKVID